MSEKTEESYQVSPQQEQLWLGSPDGPAGRVQATASLHGPCGEDGLRRALHEAVARHEILRTVFVRQPGIRVPLQAVRDGLEPAWTTAAMPELPGADDADRIAALAARERSAAIDFEHGPLLRAALVAAGESDHVLILTASSLIADAASLSLLLVELAHHLTGAGTLAPEPLQYADFAAWQLELAEADDAEAVSAGEFWRGLEGAVDLALPFTRGGGSLPVAAETVLVALGDDLAEGLSAAATRYGATLETAVHAAWCATLIRSAGAEEAILAFVAAERRHADLEGALGALSRSVPLRTELPAGVTFAELIQSLGRARADAAVWQDYAPAEAQARFHTGFIAAETAQITAGELSITLDRILDTGRDLALALTCSTGAGAPRLELSFDAEVHARETVERLARRLEQVLAAVAADPSVVVGEIALLGAAERKLILEQFNDTAAPLPSACAHELFAQHAAGAPDRTAVADEHGALSYGELEARANQLAHRLAGAGIGPGVAVGLCTDRSADMVVGLLGVLKAGGTYVPLHYEHPRARLLAQLETAGARAIVTQEPLLPQLPDFDGQVICLDRDRHELAGEPATAPGVSVGSDELAYVIYTSGSTGTPKGVGVTHANLANYASFIARRLGADGEPLSFGLVTSISTDLGNTSVYGALCSGGTLVLLSPVVAADAGAMAAQLGQTPIDVLKITPSHAGALLAGGDAGVLPRRWLVTGGERASWDLVERVRSLSDVAILNHYGPTEATIGCCTYLVPAAPGDSAPASVPIGAPIANASCYVLDDRGAPAPLGAPGRLFIGGAGVARGYVGAPELTAERFVADEFAGSQQDGSGAAQSGEAGRRAGSRPEARMYDTGDRARWLPDGNLEFLGRVDEQVKIRGYRVELGEVEAVLRRHPVVSEAVVLAQPGPAGDYRLIGYCQVSGPTDQADLLAFLQAWLPEFMLPSAIAVLDSLPQTPSGKIDRQALPDPDTLGGPAEDYVAPASPLEEAVAAIWSEVLGVERIGSHDDFFVLGGHSLLATQVVAQVRSEFAVDLPLHSLFAYPTVATLTAEIVRMMGDSEGDETAKLMAELEGLSDDEAERLLAGEPAPGDPGPPR